MKGITNYTFHKQAKKNYILSFVKYNYVIYNKGSLFFGEEVH